MPASRRKAAASSSIGSDLLLDDVDVGTSGVAEMWNKWNYVLYGIPVDKFSAWTVSGGSSTKELAALGESCVQALAFIFNSSEEFETWILRLNSQNGLQYRRVCTQSREKSGCDYLMFHCHKSGKIRIKEGGRKRKHREGKSKKLGFMCPSKIVARKHYQDATVSWRKLDGRKDIDGFPVENERVPVNAGQVSVIYYHTHAHELLDGSQKETPISETTRRVVKVWRALGMSVDEIHDNLNCARGDDENAALGLPPTVTERAISKRDLRNILVSCGMYRRDQPRSEEITESDIKAGDLLVTELQTTYGTGEGPIPPPIWGNAHPVEDSQAAHNMIKVYHHLKGATENLEMLGHALGKSDSFMIFKHRIDTMRTSMLMNTCRKLLYPTVPIHAHLADESLGMSGAFMNLSQEHKSNKNDEHNFVV